MAGYRKSCYGGSELIFTNDLYTKTGALVQVDVWGGPGLPPRFGQCRRCPAGTYGTDGLRCIPCFVGTYSNEAARECTPCPEGTYSLPTASLQYGIAAATAAPGSSTRQPLFAGASSCVACPRGYYQSEQAGSMCLPCPPGEHVQHACFGQRSYKQDASTRVSRSTVATFLGKKASWPFPAMPHTKPTES